jgi:peptide deformylase
MRKLVIAVEDDSDILRRPAREVLVFNENLAKLAEDMMALTLEHRGIAMAASQVGIDLAMFVVPIKGLVMCNPVIKMTGNKYDWAWEECLSLPGMEYQVRRYTKVVMDGQNLKGEPIRVRETGWMARVLQHEYDHIQGKLLTDVAKVIAEKTITLTPD